MARLLRTIFLIFAVAASTASAAEPSVDTGVGSSLERPNVIIVLLDDVGFAASSTFGGPIPTPNYEAIAAGGARYNRFHTTAMCSPTRASLLTGRNPHRVGMGRITNLAFDASGYNSVIPDEAATIADILRDNGYATGWFGKNHVTPLWETTPVGPFDRWPSGLGFDYYYGFMPGAIDQFSPTLVENNRAVATQFDENYILDRDLADRAIGWMREVNSYAPTKPFLLYLATGTAHEPQQAPREWIEKFRGKFDQGWDAMREESYQRQKSLGVIPSDAVNTPRPASIPAWESLNVEEKAVAARLMEVFAAQLAFFDNQFGRITQELKDSGEWENTLIIYIDGDNGATVEGGVTGSTIQGLNLVKPDISYMYETLDEMGGPRTFENVPVGFSWAMSSPFQWNKRVASHFGGTRDGLVIHWPGKIARPDVIRSQFLHVSDIAPTIYEAVGVNYPKRFNGVKQMSLDGVSFYNTFENPEASELRDSQYFEMLGNRGFYEKGWMASSIPPKANWERKRVPDAAEWDWSLFHIDTDFSQAEDLAALEPEKLAKLKSKFARAAETNHVFPIDNIPPRMMAKSPPPNPFGFPGRYKFFRNETWISNGAFPDVMNRPWSLRTKIRIDSGDSEGTIVAQGGNQGGWGLFQFKGRPTFLYTMPGTPSRSWRIAPREALAPGEHVIEIEVLPKSEKKGAGVKVTMTIDGEQAADGLIDATLLRHMPEEGVGIGHDPGTPLIYDYRSPFRFEGEIDYVEITLADEKNSTREGAHN